MPLHRSHDRTAILSSATRLPATSVLCAAVCVFAAALAGCGKSPAENQAGGGGKAAAPIRAEVLTVERAKWPMIVRTQGSLFADEVAVVGAKVAGRIAAVHVELGDVLKAGDPLVTLDQEEFRLQVAQAEAQLQQARAAVGLRGDDPVESLNPDNSPPVRQAKAVWDEARTRRDRARQLHGTNAVTQAELEQAEAAEQVAAALHTSAVNGVHEKIATIGVRAAELSLARRRLADAVIPAPFDGPVEERHVAPGGFVQVGMPIVTMVRRDPLHFRGRMPERYSRRLRIGQEVRLQVEAVAQPRVAKVTRISPTLDPLSRSLLFEARVENSDGRLWAGIFAEGDVVLDSDAETIVVPESSLSEFAGVEKVWKVVDGSAREQVVLTGERRDGRVEIVDGLAPGDAILGDADLGRVARVEPIRAGGTSGASEASGTQTKPLATISPTAAAPGTVSPATLPPTTGSKTIDASNTDAESTDSQTHFTGAAGN
jgi:RND family efflux transporter MFP subunit